MKNIFIFLIIAGSVLYSQKLKFSGEIKQASLVKCTGDNIDSAWLNDIALKVNDNSYFIFGFDRDDSIKYTLKVKYLNNAFITKEFKPRKVEIQNITTIISKIFVVYQLLVGIQKRIDY